MKFRPPILTALLFATAAALPSLVRAQTPGVGLNAIHEKLTLERPITLQIAPDGSGRRFLAQQTGKIRILPKDEGSASGDAVFLDLSDRNMAEKDFEEGLIGFAFHRDFATNRKFYVCYSQQGPKRSVVSEFQASTGDSSRADPATERILLEIPQPDWNHNSGNLVFGPQDGCLYISVGDGGLKNGVFQQPQNLTRWNGKLLRIDPTAPAEGHRNYSIPKDNPFLDNPVACPEIWALGLRNPWGSWIDAETGVFWLADVGQDLWEEINHIERGKNYGWDFREGAHDFLFRREYMSLLNLKSDPPRGTAFADPIFEYSHAEGLSITGGFVYRGDGIPSLKGCYIYGDWKFGTVWALDYDLKSKKTISNRVLYRPEDNNNEKMNPTAFCPDEKGEVIMLNWDGRMFRLKTK